MKIGDICERTGMTERTIRFYAERGLVSPAREKRNGREYMEFSEEDVSALEDIAALRDVGFPIEDIRRMQLEPESIPALVEERRAMLEGEAKESALAAAAVGLASAKQSGDVHSLAAALRLATAALPKAEVCALVPGENDGGWQEQKRETPPPRAPRDEWQNTSGMGEMSEVPFEYRGKWNWGAFLWPAVWGIGNHVYQALLCCIPIVGFFAAFYVAAKGYELAWRSKRWDSAEQFEKSQRRWALWGLVPFAVIIVFEILSANINNAETRRTEAAARARFDVFEGAVLADSEYTSLIAGREENAGSAADTFFAEGDKWYKTEGFNRENMQYAGAYGLGFTLILSDGNTYHVECMQFGDEDEPVEITIVLDEITTVSNLISVGKYAPLNAMRERYLAKTTPVVEGSAAWAQTIGQDFTYESDPKPATENYDCFYDQPFVQEPSCDAEPFSGWCAYVRTSGGTLYYAECSDYSGGTLEQPKFTVALTVDDGYPYDG